MRHTPAVPPVKIELLGAIHDATCVRHRIERLQQVFRVRVCGKVRIRRVIRLQKIRSNRLCPNIVEPPGGDEFAIDTFLFFPAKHAFVRKDGRIRLPRLVILKIAVVVVDDDVRVVPLYRFAHDGEAVRL